MSRFLVALVAPALVAACGGAPPADPAGAREASAGARVVMISVDGLMPDAYTAPDRHGLKVPTLRRLAAGGAFASGVESVFPTVTYPAHTTLVTGATPAMHGITTNRAPDPTDANQGGWRWYSEDIAVPTLWQAVEASGRPTAVITWPVTVGAGVRYRVPEVWRAGTADDQKLLRALATPGLLEAVAATRPTLWDELTPPAVRDEAQFAIARHLLVTADPELVLVHVWQTDDAQHAHGPWSDEARAAIEHVDALLGELIAALEATPAWPRTVVVVVSDHGFAPVAREIRLGALFAEHGLVAAGADGKVTAARVSTAASGGSALVYADDAAAAGEIAAAIDTLVAAGAVARVYGRDELAAAANQHQRASLGHHLAALCGELEGRRLALWGLAFKAETDDVRETPALPLIGYLRERGATVVAYDPAAMSTMRALIGDDIDYAADEYAAARGADALVVMTDWKQFRSPDFRRLAREMARPVVLDARNLWDPQDLRARGFAYRGIGRR